MNGLKSQVLSRVAPPMEEHHSGICRSVCGKLNHIDVAMLCIKTSTVFSSMKQCFVASVLCKCELY